MKTKTKTKIKNKNKNKNFHFVFHFSFGFCFCFLKVFAFFVNSTWPRGATDGQLSLDWPRTAIAFSFANFPRGLVVP